MQTQDQHSVAALLQHQLKIISEKFDLAIQNDVPLGELKKIFHEMKELKTQLDVLQKHDTNTLNPN
jgi:hypothetical protein